MLANVWVAEWSPTLERANLLALVGSTLACENRGVMHMFISEHMKGGCATRAQ